MPGGDGGHAQLALHTQAVGSLGSGQAIGFGIREHNGLREGVPAPPCLNSCLQMSGTVPEI